MQIPDIMENKFEIKRSGLHLYSALASYVEIIAGCVEIKNSSYAVTDI